MTGYGWTEIGSKLKAAAAKKDDSDAVCRLRVLNQLGAQGWELVSYRKNDVYIEVWLFKRRVSK